MEVQAPSTADAVRALSNEQQQPSTQRNTSNDVTAAEPQASTVVQFSAQAQQLNQAEGTSPAQAANTNVSTNGNQVTETAQPAGIDFMTGDSKGGNVNTFA